MKIRLPLIHPKCQVCKKRGRRKDMWWMCPWPDDWNTYWHKSCEDIALCEPEKYPNGLLEHILDHREIREAKRERRRKIIQRCNEECI